MDALILTILSLPDAEYNLVASRQPLTSMTPSQTFDSQIPQLSY